MKPLFVILLCVAALNANAQHFSISKVDDSHSVLTLDTDSTHREWHLRYPVYRFCTGDVDGDGKPEALVGVIKPTRFIHETDKRLFIFKNSHGRIQRMWMGSKVGGQIIDFCFYDGNIVCLSRMNEGKCTVSKWTSSRFGLDFVGYVCEDVDEAEAMKAFNVLDVGNSE